MWHLSARASWGALVGLALLASSASAQDAPARDPNFGRGERVSGESFATRSPVVAPHGAAATAHPLATQTAIDVLRSGGSAIDAAIAANAMLGLVEPTGNGVGGDIFVIVWDPRTQRLYGYNGSGRTPRGMSLAEMRREARRRGNPNAVPSFGAASVSVPGTVDGWFALHERFGRKPMAELLAPAIRYAREGAPIPQTIAMYWANNRRRLETEFAAGRLQEIDNARATYFCQENCADDAPDARWARPLPQSRSRQHARANRERRTRRLLSRTDRTHDRCLHAPHRRLAALRRFRRGIRANGSIRSARPIAMSKYANCRRTRRASSRCRRCAFSKRYNLREMGFLSADSLHTQIEATRLAFADRAQFYGDPAFTHFDTRRLLTDEYTAQRRAMISNDRAMPPPPHAELRIDGDTTYLTTAD